MIPRDFFTDFLEVCEKRVCESPGSPAKGRSSEAEFPVARLSIPEYEPMHIIRKGQAW